MKKLVVIFVVFMLLCAFSWPPENYEMPRTVLDAATAEKSLSGLRASAGSIANTGLILIGIITSVSLISTFLSACFWINWTSRAAVFPEPFASVFVLRSLWQRVISGSGI